MNVQQRIDLLVQLGKYITADGEDWQAAKHSAYAHNQWFIPQFVKLATDNIVSEFLQQNILEELALQYQIADVPAGNKTVGVVMAGNIPLVGFHDFLCVFLSGRKQLIKASCKDEVLIKHLVKKLTEWNSEVADLVSFAEMLKNCDAYIATGSNNSGRYFEYYFSKYPSIIRKNRTSVAVLDGTETTEELNLLADDIQQYFGLGCRNVTKLFVPENYNFIPLLDALKKYEYFAEYNKYKSNFDYHLALLIMGNKLYMNNGSIILTEEQQLFAPVGQINYSVYLDKKETESILNNQDVQCIVGHSYLPFGEAQKPCITNFADGVDTLDFLVNKV